VRYAIDFDEWYDKKPEDGVKKATALLEEAKKRIASLKENKTPWMDGTGQKVLGFYSKIDDSAQPYGVEIPEGLEIGKKRSPCGSGCMVAAIPPTISPLFTASSWRRRAGSSSPRARSSSIPLDVIAMGWKSAGEVDVFECRDDAIARFKVDTNRIALAGFSMGGAGAGTWARTSPINGPACIRAQALWM